MNKTRLTFLPIAYIKHSESGVEISDKYFKNSKRVSNLSGEQASEDIMHVKYTDENWIYIGSDAIIPDPDAIISYKYNLADKLLSEFTKEIEIPEDRSLLEIVLRSPKKYSKHIVHITGWVREKGDVVNNVIYTNNWLIKTSDSNIKHII